jgi:hypothetical protein
MQERTNNMPAYNPTSNKTSAINVMDLMAFLLAR